MISTQVVQSTIEKHVNDNKMDLRQRLPRGSIPEMIKLYGFSKYDITYALSKIKRSKGYRVQSSGTVSKTVTSDLQTYCLNNELYRSSNDEVTACNKIIAAMNLLLPRGGKGMLIGTPTAFCASRNTNNNLFITDNLEVATILKFTTDEPITIIVGNAVNPAKAMLKAQHWKSNSITKNSNVYVNRVDSFSYQHYVSNFASGGDLCKVILLTSGIWKDSKKSKWKREKKGIYLNLDYETPSILLTNMYPNLHILAITKEVNHSFSVRYLNDGENSLLKWKED